MKYSPIKRDVSKYRFALPNDIWTQNLKPPAFAVLAYLQYRHCRKFGGIATAEELAGFTRMSVEMAQSSVETLLKAGLITTDLVPVLSGMEKGKFFSIPDEVFHLNLDTGQSLSMPICCAVKIAAPTSATPVTARSPPLPDWLSTP